MNKYLAGVIIALAFALAIMCFVPQSTYFKNEEYFKSYDFILNERFAEQVVKTDETNISNEQTSNTPSDETNAKELDELSKTIDTLDFERKVKDVVNDFFYNIKYEKYDEAEKFLAEGTYTKEENSVMKVLRYNSQYKFFKDYLSSYEVKVLDVIRTEEDVVVNINLRRYDINKLQRKLLSTKFSNDDENKKLSRDEIIYEYEMFFRDEFSNSNVPYLDKEYTIHVVLINNEFKIVNDDDFMNIVASKDVMM